MLNTEGLDCHTGTVKSTGEIAVIEFSDNQKLRTCFLDATTQFIGTMKDELAMKSLGRNARSVNVWLPKDTDTATYASINFG